MADYDTASSPISELLHAPRNKEEKLQLVSNVWDYVSKSRYGLHYVIKESMHMVAGQQWIRFNQAQNSFDRHSLEEWVPTPTTNYLVETFDYIKDLFTSGDIGPTVDPSTRDQEDIDRAKAAQRILRSEFERLDSETELLGNAASWLALTGNAVLFSTWNGLHGDLVKIPRMKMRKEAVTYDIMRCPSCGWSERAEVAPERCASCSDFMVGDTAVERDLITDKPIYETHEEQHTDKAGKPVFDEVRLGNLEEHVVNLLNFYPQPTREWKDIRYAIETDVMDIDRVKDLFGSKAKNVTAENIHVDDWAGAFSLKMTADQNLEDSDINESDKCIVKIFRHVPDRRFKRGKLIICTHDTILFDGDLDSCDGKLPYTLIKYRDVPGSFWGQGPIPDQLPSQKRINAIDSNIVQNRKQMVNPQWLIPEGAGISRVSGRAGLVLRWSPHSTGGYKPEKVPGVPLPQQVLGEREQTRQDMRSISGIHELMQGQLPSGSSGLETGAAVEFIFERAYKRFGVAIRQWRGGLAEHFHRNLKILEKYLEEDRIVRVLGDNSELESYYYSNSDFFNTEDMVVRTGVGLQGSDVAYQQRIMQAAQQGLLGNIQAPVIRGKILEKLDIEGFDSEYVLDAKKARRVLMALRDQKEPDPILPQIDNHAIQFTILRDFMLSSDFYKLNDEIKASIQERAQQHQQIMQQQQQQVMQAAQATKGAGDQAAQAVQDSGAMGQQGVPTQGVQ